MSYRRRLHERARAGGAVAVRLIVGDPGAARRVAGLQTDELGRLAAHLEDGLGFGVQRRDATRDGLELVLEAGFERLPDEPAARPGDAHAGEPALRKRSEQRVEQRLRRLAWTSLDAPVADDEDRPAFDHGETLVRGLEEVGVPGEQIAVQIVVIGLAGKRCLEADAADVDAE
jgi:hypothetical protein